MAMANKLHALKTQRFPVFKCLMIIASINRMASGVLPPFKPPAQAKINHSSLHQSCPFPQWLMYLHAGRKPLNHACEFLPQRLFFFEEEQAVLPLKVISSPAIYTGMHQLPYTTCPGMLRNVQRQYIPKGRRCGSFYRQGILPSYQGYVVNFNKMTQDDHLNSYFYKREGSRLFLTHPRWSS